MNSNNRRRNFRPRSHKNNFRRRNGSLNSNGGSGFNKNGNLGFNKNGNLGFNRNGSMNNPHNVEKAMEKFQQLAKDAQSSGDPILAENYLQHADHYSRKLTELNGKFKDNSNDKSEILSDANLTKDSQLNKETTNQTIKKELP